MIVTLWKNANALKITMPNFGYRDTGVIQCLDNASPGSVKNILQNDDN